MWAIGLILLAALGPFLNKAVNTDDALFIWAGQWIQKHPVDFYGVTVNWWISDVPMWVANWNPPLLSYLFACVGALFGWREAMLHLFCLGLALGGAAGIHALAKAWCTRPLLATLIAIFSPAFLVSSSTLMCDVLMFAFWIWAMVLWERATIRTDERWLFVGAGILAALAVLSKYSAVTLLPLLPLLSILRSRRPGFWLVGLAVPVLLLAAYEFLTAQLYGQGLFAAASYHARTFRPGFAGGWKATAIIGICFAGGSVLPAAFLAPLLWRPKIFLAGVLVTGGGAVSLYAGWDTLGLSADAGKLHSWSYITQVILMAAAGAHLLALAVFEFWRRRDAISAFLLAWVASVMFFAIVVNWLINARSFLPLVPAAAILLARRLEEKNQGWTARFGPWCALVPAAALAAMLVASDDAAADLERKAAREIVGQYHPTGHQLWFVGHGAFQYYMQQGGGRPIDATCSELKPGDVVAVPLNNYGITTLPKNSVGWLGYKTYVHQTWMNLAGQTAGSAAGFYGANWGPIPFAWGRIPRQTYFVLKVFSGLKMDSKCVNRHGPAIDDVPNIPTVSCVVENPLVIPAKPETSALLQQGEKCEVAGDEAGAMQAYRSAVAVDAGNPDALNHLAWILATGPRELRRGGEAVELSAKAVAITDSRVPEMLETLAAAYAESGRFSEAMETAQIAASLAHVTGQQKVEQENFSLLRLYRAGRTGVDPKQ